MSFYADLATTAHALLLEYGRAVTLTRVARGAYNPATGEPAAGTTTNYTGYAVLVNYAQRDIDGTAVRTGDQQAYIGTDGMVLPQTADTLMIGSRSYQVVSASEIAPAGVPVLYVAQVRGVQ